jgi:LemA protein
MAILVTVFVFVVAVAVAWLYNGLVARRNEVRSAWAQIDVQLKRRHDLIPNLVAAVRGYLDHERTLLEHVTEARTRAVDAAARGEAREAAENALSGALGRLLATVEAYPQLRASENVLLLQEELSSTENRIAFARQFLNDRVGEYNTARESFPANFLAESLGFRAERFFQIELAAERAAPRVAVSGPNDA